MNTLRRQSINRRFDDTLSGKKSEAERKEYIGRVFRRLAKSRNGNVLSELYCISQRHKFGNELLVEGALKKYESETQEIRELLAQRNRGFGISEIARYLVEFLGYRNFNDVLAQLRLAGVCAEEWMNWHVLRNPKGALEPLRRAGYSAKEIILAYEQLLQEEFGGNRRMNAPDVVDALLKAGFDCEEAVIGLRQAGYTPSEAGLGMLGARIIINGNGEALRQAGELEWEQAYEIAQRLVDGEMVTFAAKMVSAGYCAPEVIQNIEETFLKLRETSPLDANLLIRIRDRCLAASGTFVLVRS